MSIATEKARIKRNVSAALAKIAGKGVTVPEGSNSDALAGLIEAIEAGGGGAESKCIHGSFIPVDDTSEIIIDDAFPYSTQPIVFGCVEIDYIQPDTSHTVIRMRSYIAERVISGTDKSYLITVSYNKADTFVVSMINSLYTSFNSKYRNGNSFYECMQGLINGETRQLLFRPNSSGGYYLAGKTYHWFILFGDDAA